MRVGFDLDGVLAEVSTPLWLLTGLAEAEIREVIYDFLLTPKLKFHPRQFLHEEDEYVIITGRSSKYRSLTERWLKHHGIECSSLFMCDVGVSKDYPSLSAFFNASAMAKARYIKSECIDVFFDDNPDIVARLRKLCPKVRIIQIGGRLI